MQRSSFPFVYLCLGLVVLVQVQGPHPPDHGPHEQRCVDAVECHCDHHAPDNIPVCEDGHCTCHHSCLHNNECHCDPPSPDKVPTCVDGQCTCQHTGNLQTHVCTHNAECHCEPPSPDNAPMCIDGQCSCQQKDFRCTHNDECHIHCEPHGPDHTPLCVNGQCSCHHADRCVHDAECHIHCEPHGPDRTPLCVNGQCSCHHAGKCVHNDECHCDPNTLNNKALCIDGQCSCHSKDYCFGDQDCQCGLFSNPRCVLEQCTCSAQTSCHDNSDCAGSHCSIQGLHPFCRTSLANGQSNCDCTDCTEDHHCASKCGSGATPKCNSSLVHGYSCYCENIVSASTTPSTTSISWSKTTKDITTQVSQTSVGQSSTSASTLGKDTTITTQTSIKPFTLLTLGSSVFVTITNSSSQATTSPVRTKTTSASTTTVPITNSTPQVLSHVARSCHTCGSPTASSPCDTRSIYLGNLQSCTSGSDFCMTDIVHDSGGSVQIYKRCVTETECINKWLHQSSDLDYCTNYGNVLGQGHYSCHFCCTSNGCNSKIVPPKSTWYTKS